MSMTLFDALQVAFELEQLQVSRCRNGLTGPTPSRPHDEDIEAARVRLQWVSPADLTEEVQKLVLNAYKVVCAGQRARTKEYFLEELFEMGPIKIDAAVTYEAERHVHFIREDGTRGFYKHKV